MSCWTPLSAFQMANVLMLIIALPFLIAMIATYVFYGLVSNESGSCAVFCCYLLEGLPFQLTNLPNDGAQAKDNTPPQLPETEAPPAGAQQQPPPAVAQQQPPSEEPAQAPRSVDFPSDFAASKEAVHPSVGALLESLYQDDYDEHIFKCPVAIIAKRWAVAMDGCIGREMALRVGSSYWATGGRVKEVKEVIYLDKASPSLVLVHFAENNEVEPVKMANLSSGAIRSFSWINGRLYGLAERRKFETLKALDVEFFQKDDCVEYGRPKHVSCYFTRKSNHCGDEINGPMIDDHNNLVGLHLETLCEENKEFSVIFYININDYNAKIKTIIM